MFTGIIEQTGQVTGIRNGTLTIRAKLPAKVGDSVAVNGVCLTVVANRAGKVRFDVLEETLRRTNFGALRAGSLVNMERPLRAAGRLDGHFVQGHVDGTGKVRSWKGEQLEIIAPVSLMKYVVEKGSIAIDGISLTVAAVGRNWFRVCIIPHTRQVTNLRARRVGEAVNLEIDILAKYVERLLRRR